jgi:penicillin-binding protein 2
VSWSEFSFSLGGGSQPRDLRSRLGACAIGILVVFVLLLGRLWMLQVVEGEKYAALAQKNTLKEREIAAPRGAIYEAHGHRIAEVRATFDLVISPSDVEDEDETSAEDEGLAMALGGPARVDPSNSWDLPTKLKASTLATRLAPLLDGIEPAELIEAIETAPSRWRPVVLREGLSPDELTRIMSRRPWLPGVRVASRHRRVYPDKDLFAHLLGYMREVRSDELAYLRERYADQDKGSDWYRPGDMMGKYGIESAYEPYLRGRAGAYWAQVDVHGRELGRSTGFGSQDDEYFLSIAHFLDRGLRPEIPGHDIYLTVRRDLQELAVRLLGERSGSVVMMEVETGRVLAIANAPRFDPEIFSRKITPEDWAILRDDPAHPLVDKALQGVYPPASTWKMITAAAVLGSETWTSRTRVFCNGGHKVGKRRFRCWNRRGHGSVNLREALAGSCDVYFYRAGLAVGIDEVARYGAMFGMGRPTGIGLNSEVGAINPSTAWKRKRFAGNPKLGKWSPGDTASAVIGQGFTLVTPMQLARMTATIANGGRLYRPLLVDRVVGPDGEVVMHNEPEIVGTVDLAPEHFDAIRKGMFGVIEDSTGTARRQRLKSLAYAGKTGTAQVVALSKVRRRSDGTIAERFRDHALFVAFAPYDNPEIAISVMIEHGEHGSTVAAPIARELLEYYFNEQVAAAADTGQRVGQPAGPRRARWSHSRQRRDGPGEDAFVPVPGVRPEDL